MSPNALARAAVVVATAAWFLSTPTPAPAQSARTRGELPFNNPKWTGDFDGMVKRGRIRVLVVHSKTQYFVDKGVQYGASYELLKAFEDSVNAARRRAQAKGAPKLRKVEVLFVPTSRDDIVPALVDGRGDIAAAALTITPERLKHVDFSEPGFRGVNEIVVTGPQSPPLATLDDLSGKDVLVRKSSSYWQHLEALNARFAQAGKPPATLRAAPESLEDEDLMEMVNAGLVGIVVVDDYKAALWAKVLTSLKLRPDLAVNRGGEIGWMIRKNSPLLKAETDAFVKTHGQGTAFGNTIVRRYTGSTKFVKSATSAAEIAKFQQVVELFRKYAAQYDMDHLLMLAQGYQESRLEQEAKSHVGAVGVMQLMPATGKGLQVGDITQLEPNIHAGVKYMRFMVDRYYEKEPMDAVNKILFAFASYNAGAGRVASLRRETAKNGLDPNVWFHNVEVTAGARMGSETITYVSNIYKYYVAYKLLDEEQEERRRAREQLQKR